MLPGRERIPGPVVLGEWWRVSLGSGAAVLHDSPQDRIPGAFVAAASDEVRHMRVAPQAQLTGEFECLVFVRGHVQCGDIRDRQAAAAIEPGLSGRERQQVVALTLEAASEAAARDAARDVAGGSGA